MDYDLRCSLIEYFINRLHNLINFFVLIKFIYFYFFLIYFKLIQLQYQLKIIEQK